MVSQMHPGVRFAHPEHTLNMPDSNLMSTNGVRLSPDVLVEVGDLVGVALVQAWMAIPLGVNYILSQEGLI